LYFGLFLEIEAISLFQLGSERRVSTSLIIIGFLFALAGLAGAVLPVIPGPPLSFFALIILSFARDWEPFGLTFLIIMASLTAAVTLLDYVVPAVGAKKFGASKLAVWGSIIGLIIGLFVFPPWGVIVGAFLGAVLGEALRGKGGRAVLRAGFGVFVGNMVGVGLKLALSGLMFFFYVKEML
jgi:uncharacterized protein YqgC (DUF456 family)